MVQIKTRSQNAIETASYGSKKKKNISKVSLECIGVNQKNTVKTLLKCEVIDEKFFFFDKN